MYFVAFFFSNKFCPKNFIVLFWIGSVVINIIHMKNE